MGNDKCLWHHLYVKLELLNINLFGGVNIIFLCHFVFCQNCSTESTDKMYSCSLKTFDVNYKRIYLKKITNRRLYKVAPMKQN
jgi:hypothetical protein